MIFTQNVRVNQIGAILFGALTLIFSVLGVCEIIHDSRPVSIDGFFEGALVSGILFLVYLILYVKYSRKELRYKNAVDHDLKECAREKNADTVQFYKEYQVPAKEIQDSENKDLNRAGRVCGILTVMIEVAVLVLTLKDGELRTAARAVPGMAIVYIVFYAIPSLVLLPRRSAVSNIPRRICIYYDSVMIDDMRFSRNTIKSIRMTPTGPVPATTTQTSPYRIMKIVTADGDNSAHTYSFGPRVKTRKNVMYCEYDNLIADMITWCDTNRIDMKMDLY